MNKQRSIFVFIYFVSFLLLILNLNYNVRTFKLTQDLQSLTLELQSLKREVDLKELSYYTKTSLDNVYNRATEKLGMIRQQKIRSFTNHDVMTR